LEWGVPSRGRVTERRKSAEKAHVNPRYTNKTTSIMRKKVAKLAPKGSQSSLVASVSRLLETTQPHRSPRRFDTAD
jgi:hypothetical protein